MLLCEALDTKLNGKLSVKLEKPASNKKGNKMTYPREIVMSSEERTRLKEST